MLEPYQRFVDDARRRMDIGLTRTWTILQA